MMVNGPNRSPVTRSTEHEVWNDTEPEPEIWNVVSAEKPPETVNTSPSDTEAEKPPAEIVAVAGNVPVSWPYALLPWLFWFAPCEVYLIVSDDGRFLFPREQIVHGGGGGGGGGGGRTGFGQLDPAKSILLRVGASSSQQPYVDW